MNQIRGRCVICTSLFTSNNIAALHCGHTFHFLCISKWVERSKTCPICRVTTAERHIVKHLYFDSADDPNASQVEISSAAQVESLSIALEQEKNNYTQAVEEVLRLTSLVDKLEAKLAAEKKCYREKIPSLQARNRQLEMMLVDQQELQKKFERIQNRLRACEFYKAITTTKDESAIDKYIRDDGALEVGQFLNILRRQLDEARKTQLKLKDDLKVERESVRALKKKEQDLKNIVAILEKELRDVRGSANIGSTPFNPKLRSLALDQSPSRRVSLGFNESVELNADVLSSALRRRARGASPRTRPGTSSVPKPLFANLSDDEDEVEAAASDVSLEYPAKLDSIPSPRIPKTMRERLLSGCTSGLRSRPTGFGGVQGAAAKALASLENRNTDVISRKPGLKRKLNQNDRDNQRLSQFFPRRNPSDTIILDD